MKMKLTETSLAKYKPRSDRDEIFDTERGGFGVRVTPSSKAFFFIRRVGGKKVRFDLGRFMPKEALAKARKSSDAIGIDKFVTLSEARRKAEEILIKIENRTDPRVEAQARKRTKAEQAEKTFAWGVNLFLEKYPLEKKAAGKKPLRQRTLEGYRWALLPSKSKNKARPTPGDLIAKWADRPLVDIRKSDVRDVILRLEDRENHSSARLFHAYVHKFFDWCASSRREYITVNPAAGFEFGSSGEGGKGPVHERIEGNSRRCRQAR